MLKSCERMLEWDCLEEGDHYYSFLNADIQVLK